MGTEHRGDSSTQKLDDHGDGNWDNPQIAAQNERYLAQEQQARVSQGAVPGQGASYPQQAAARQIPYPEHYRQPLAPVGRDSYRPRRRPLLGIFRRFLCILLLPATLLAVLVASLAYWSESTLINTARFTELTAPLAKDAEFQQALADSVTSDIMSSEPVSTYLGDGNSTSWLGGVQNWLYDQTQTLVHGATETAVRSEEFSQLWTAVIRDSHAYNFAGESRPAILDLSAVYDRASSAVSGVIGLNLDTSDLPGSTINLDDPAGSYPINGAINTLIGFAHSWIYLAILALALALLTCLLWPGNRFAFLAANAFLGAGALWLAGLVGGGLSLTSGLTLPSSTTGVLFIQKLAEIMTGSYADFHYQLALYALLAGVGLTLLAILSAVLKLTARATTAYSH